MINMIYRVESKDIHTASALVAKCLNSKLLLRDSSFYGGDYYLAKVGGEVIMLFINLDSIDDEPIIDECDAGDIVLRIENTKRGTAIEQAIASNHTCFQRVL